MNGELVASGAAEELVESHGSLRIGCGDNNGYWDWFDGRIDEPRVYDRVLSPGEIAGDMQSPLGTPKQGPVADYSLDSVTEGTVEDFAGNNDGTVEGAKLTEPGQGRYGSALEFDGEEGCVTIPDGPQFQMGEEFTLEAWVRPEGPHEFSPVFYKQDGEGGYGYALWADTVGGEPEGEVNDGTYPVPRVEGKAELPADTWSHLAFTYDGAKMRLYVDGELVDSGAAEAPIESEGPLKIGCADDYGYDHYFEGRIDEPRVYERALSAGELAADMENPIETPKSGPVAAYSFDEGEAGDETVEDVSGNKHTATIEGEAEWTKGRYGGALGFLKEGDCASVADSPELRLTEEFTIEAWVRPDGGIYEDPVVVRESGGEDLFGLGIGSTEEGHAEAFIGEGPGSKTAVGGKEIREYEWVHLAATWDGSKIRLYVDGELAATKATSTPPGTGEGDLKIGCDAPEGPFGGRIDEVRVYRRTLNGAEVAADMETPLQTPKATPVAKYSFDEENEESAQDLTGDGHTATVEGPKWTEHGRYGGAYEFDAEEGDILKIPASPELNFEEEFTLEAWVRPSGAENKAAPLIDKQEGSGLGYFLYEGGIVSDRPVGAVDEEQEHVHADDPLPAHAWSHIALTFTGNRTYIYVDGELIDNGAAEPVVTPEGELQIGGSTDTGEYFDGRIDEVRVYNRGLDQAEVDADMEAPIQTPKREPVAAYSFDENKGSTVEDLTGDGHTATIHGAEWTTRGKYGGAMEFFSSKESYLSIPDSPSLDLNEQFTLEAEVRPTTEAGEFEPLVTRQATGSSVQPWFLYASSDEAGVPYGGTQASAEEKGSVRGEAPLPAGVWSYLALTYDGAHIRIYVDGELVDECLSPSPISAAGDLELGGATEVARFFSGRIDDVQIYDRALNTSEVISDMGPHDLMAVSTAESEGTLTRAVALLTYSTAGDQQQRSVPHVSLAVSQLGPVPGDGLDAAPLSSGVREVEGRPYIYKYCPYFEGGTEGSHNTGGHGPGTGKELKLFVENVANEGKIKRGCPLEGALGGEVKYTIEELGTIKYDRGKIVEPDEGPLCAERGNPSLEKKEEKVRGEIEEKPTKAKEEELLELELENLKPDLAKEGCFVKPAAGGTKSTNGLDVIGRWHWNPAEDCGCLGEVFQAPQNDPQSSPQACGELDGHIPIYPPAFSKEETITGRSTGEHLYVFESHLTAKRVQGCFWNDKTNQRGYRELEFG